MLTLYQGTVVTRRPSLAHNSLLEPARGCSQPSPIHPPGEHSQGKNNCGGSISLGCCQTESSLHCWFSACRPRFSSSLLLPFLAFPQSATVATLPRLESRITSSQGLFGTLIHHHLYFSSSLLSRLGLHLVPLPLPPLAKTRPSQPGRSLLRTSRQACDARALI